jgi:hypothetical protein
VIEYVYSESRYLPVRYPHFMAKNASSSLAL